MNVVLLRVGIDSGSGGIQSPLFEDGTFEFIPIPDGLAAKVNGAPTYGNTLGRYGRLLIDYFPLAKRAKMFDQPMHVDPEFETFTYGDPTPPKRGLSRLRSGDLLVFYAGLEGWGHKAEPALYIVGYFEISHVGFAPQFSDAEIAKLFSANAHVRNPGAFGEQRSRLLLVRGGASSRLLRQAVRISASGKNSLGQPLKILSPAMQQVFGDFDGKVSIQRSPPRWVLPGFVERASSFVRSLT